LKLLSGRFVLYQQRRNEDKKGWNRGGLLQIRLERSSENRFALIGGHWVFRRPLDYCVFVQLYFEENNLISFENKILNDLNISEQDTEEASRCLHIIEIWLKLSKTI
jgi:hypothetical protein